MIYAIIIFFLLLIIFSTIKNIFKDDLIENYENSNTETEDALNLAKQNQENIKYLTTKINEISSIFDTASTNNNNQKKNASAISTLMKQLQPVNSDQASDATNTATSSPSTFNLS